MERRAESLQMSARSNRSPLEVAHEFSESLYG
jgi:hypothetical protein